MNKNTEQNNQVKVTGMVATELAYSHEVYGEKFYTFSLEVQRASENVDSVPVMVSDRLIDISKLEFGIYVSVEGSFRSHNKEGHLILSVFADDIVYADAKKNDNEIKLSGYLCKAPTHRTTPLGREIADLLVAVNRAYGKSDYLPCISWGRNAAFCSTLDVGTHIEATGRIQSRMYMKDDQEHIAYEVSISSVQVM